MELFVVVVIVSKYFSNVKRILPLTARYLTEIHVLLSRRFQ